MKSNVFLISAFRVAIINQNALNGVLLNDQINRGELDVFDIESLLKDHILQFLPNVLVVHYLGYITESHCCRYFQGTVEDI